MFKRLLLSAVFLVSIAYPVEAAVTLVTDQVAFALFASSTSSSDDFPANTTAGNGILVLVGVNDPGGSITVVDDCGNTYTQVVDHQSAGSRVVIAFDLDIAGGTCEITIGVTLGNTTGSWAAFEITGQDTSALRGTNSAFQFDPGTGTDALSSGTVSGLTGDLYLSITFEGSTAALVPVEGTGYTLLGIGNASGRISGWEHRTLSGDAVIAGTWTGPGSGTDWLTGVIVAKSAVTAGTGTRRSMTGAGR